MRGWALVLALALAGCGKKKPPEAPANTGAKATDETKPAEDPAKKSKHAPDDADGAGPDEDPCAGGK